MIYPYVAEFTEELTVFMDQWMISVTLIHRCKVMMNGHMIGIIPDSAWCDQFVKKTKGQLLTYIL